MIYTHCIWDFNGTILDDVDLGIYCVNILLRERGLGEIPSKEIYRKKFDFPGGKQGRDLCKGKN